MYSIGLKLWSINTGKYLYEAQRLYEDGVYDYIELYVVPNTLETLSSWKNLNIPFIIHNAHFAHGFNLAQKVCRARNRNIYEQSKKFADELKAESIIFHGGIDGAVEEVAFQLLSLQEERAILENKPFMALPNRMGGTFCRGATKEELTLILKETHCQFCLDFGHAVCSASSQGINPYDFIQHLMGLTPCMFHLSDVKDLSSPYDSHPHLGTGMLDMDRLIRHVLPRNAIISVETVKDHHDNLEDFVKDVEWLKLLY
jgi:deoxyribonuclease IV